MKRRLFALLLCFLLCAGLLTAQAAETDLPTVTAEQVTAAPGETVSAAKPFAIPFSPSKRVAGK